MLEIVDSNPTGSQPSLLLIENVKTLRQVLKQL